MKFKKSILCLLLCLTLTGLAACGNSAPSLSGTYSAETFGTTMTYTFDGDSVTAQFFMGGYEIGRYEGTYSLNDDETQITLSFDPEQMPNGADLPAGLTSLGGTFTFQQGENYVMIGQVRYDRAEGDTENSGQGSLPLPAEEPEPSEPDGISPISLRLDLPEEYAIQYTVHEEYGWSHDYTQTMIKSRDGYYFDFGDTGEQYLFLRQDSGKYLQYKYDAGLGEYSPTMLTPDIQALIDSGVMTEDMVSLDSNVVSGYAARITTNFDLYQAFVGHLRYAGEETVAGISCQQFTASFEEVWGTQEAKVWIDPETGLCMKAEYRYQAPNGTVGVRQIECTQWETDEITLPPLS